jgi:5'-methylthioadenosine phosphorylase
MVHETGDATVPEPVPKVTGERVGVVIGSSFESNPFAVVQAVELDVMGDDGLRRPVALDDCGDFVVILRHGPAGTLPAHLVDHHAHVRALCAAGCSRVLAIGSGGGLRPDLGPGCVIAPDDFLALTTYPTFHATTAGYAMPGFDLDWRHRVVDTWRASSPTPIIDGGTYAMVRGPRFETRSEIRMLAAYADIVGMTIAAECILAREAGLAYAAVCRVDNLANGVADHDLEVEEYRENARALAEGFAADIRATLDALVAPAV